MASAIDATKPEDGVPASKPVLRANLLAAKDELEDLQGPVITDATTARTLAMTDLGSYIRFTSGSAVALTVPTNATVAFAVGDWVNFRQAGAGAVTVGGTPTVNAPAGGTLVSAGAGATCTLKKVATDEWDLIGQTVSV